MKIGIVLGSIREGRIGEAVGNWVLETATARDDATYSIVDLKSFNVPLLTSATVPAMAGGVYDSPEVQNWSAAIAELDGFIFVTPEYNHGIPGAFKNAVDSLGPEWTGKAVGFVSYGADGGTRAVEQWRQVVANFSMHAVRGQVSLSLFTEFGPDGFAPLDRRAGELTGVLDQVVSAATKLGG